MQFIFMRLVDYLGNSDNLEILVGCIVVLLWSVILGFVRAGFWGKEKLLHLKIRVER